MTAGEWVRKAPSTAQRRLAGAATNEAATLNAPPKTTRYWLKRRMTAHQYASTWFERLRKETRGVWTCVRIVYEHFDPVGQYMDQSSSRGLKKFGEDILTSPEGSYQGSNAEF